MTRHHLSIESHPGMAEHIIPPKAKLFVGIIFSSEVHLYKTERALVRKYGEIDYRSHPILFDNTVHYRDGNRAQCKLFISFQKLIRREDIAAIKLMTNRLEKRFIENEKRRVNIDPGYLTLSNVFVASCKEYFHRIYLEKGVYLENEYRYVSRHFQPWDWTYPDFRKPEYLAFFHDLRRLYYRQLES